MHTEVIRLKSKWDNLPEFLHAFQLKDSKHR